LRFTARWSKAKRILDAIRSCGIKGCLRKVIRAIAGINDDNLKEK